MKTANVFNILLLTVAILLVPLVAMGFTTEVNWTLADFVVMGTLIFSTGLAYELISRKVDKKYRMTIGLLLLGVFLLIWADLAVGIFNIPGFSGS